MSVHLLSVCRRGQSLLTKTYDARLGRLLLTMILSVLSAIPAAATTENTLYSFNWFPPPGQPNPGAYPVGPLLRGPNGALYGAATLGGAHFNGTIYRLTPPAPGYNNWTMSVIYTFTGGFDGGGPNANLVTDASGAIYGTTKTGGSWVNQGVAFKLTPPRPGGTQWSYKVIHYFYHNPWEGAAGGANPSGGLIMDKNGALYGTTNLGGTTSDYIGFGTVFKLTPLDSAKTNWQEKVLYRFKGGTDGANPMFALTLDSNGRLYGTTLYGGIGGCHYGDNCGTVFRLSPAATGQTWTKTTLHKFTNGPDGGIPQGKLLLDSAGNIYGAAFQGGTGHCTDSWYNDIGCGVIFRLAPPAPGQSTWTQTVLHDFLGPEGAFPQGGVIAGPNGTLYGLTSAGGPSSYGGMLGSDGTFFKITRPAPGGTYWIHKVLYNFVIGISGREPVGELVRDPAGRLFGVAYGGGQSYGGTIFEIIP